MEANKMIEIQRLVKKYKETDRRNRIGPLDDLLSYISNENGEYKQKSKWSKSELGWDDCFHSTLTFNYKKMKISGSIEHHKKYRLNYKGENRYYEKERMFESYELHISTYSPCGLNIVLNEVFLYGLGESRSPTYILRSFYSKLEEKISEKGLK